VTPSHKGQTQATRVVRPAGSDVIGSESQEIAPPRESQAPQALELNPSHGRRTENQPLRITPPKKDGEQQPSQSKANQDEKDKKHE
jgi:hypothetical protein